MTKPHTLEHVQWEVAWLTDAAKPVSTHDLHEYGGYGWELVSVILLPGAIREFFFKRQRAARS